MNENLKQCPKGMLCLREQCALWDDDKNCCAILSLSRSLDKIVKKKGN